MGFLDRLLGRADRSGEPAPTTPSSSYTGPRFAVVDVETTGLAPENHRILEVAVVRTDPWGRVLDEWSSRVNPQGPVGATHVHGIRDSDVANAPTFDQLIGELNSRLAGAAVVAHHARFDLAFLRAEYRRAGWQLPHLPAMCTLEASQHHLPHLDRRRLTDCCWAAGVPLQEAHSALGDARATAGLLGLFMHPHIGTPPLPAHLAMPAEALGVAWPTGPATVDASNEVLTPPSTRAPRVLSDRALEQIARKSQDGPPAPLTVLVAERFSLLDALDEGAPSGAVPYLEKLAEVLEDGKVTEQEAAELAAVAEAEELTREDLTAANLAFVRALAYAALEDGKVSRAERSELLAMAALLGADDKIIPALLDQAEHARDLRLSADLKPLPPDWAHGEPLRVGDKVVFTGCEEGWRSQIEDRSTSLGIRILGAVSPKVIALVSDGSMDGTKAARARDLGTRIIEPKLYDQLLEHLQPALPRNVRSMPKPRNPATGRHAANAAQPDAPGAPGHGADPAAIRAWAREHGHPVGTRGRIHQDIVAAYRVAHLDGS